MKGICKRIWLNRSYCFTSALELTGGVFTLWSTIALFVTFDNLFEETTWVLKLIFALLIILLVFVISFFVSAFTVLKQNIIELMDVGNQHHVYVQYGDVFSPDIIGKNASSQKRNILISVNRCFDTIVDDNLISNCSLHGKAINILCEKEEFTPSKIDKEIQRQLKNKDYILVDRKQKPQGNLKRYSEGTVVEIKESADITFFFLGLTSFDNNLHPFITDEEYIIALAKALRYCLDRNQGYPVIIPLVGGGRAETKKHEKDILEFLIELIKLNKQSINCDIHIVVRESAKDSIPIFKI